MKITAYEVRPDEKDYLLAAAQQEQIEITLVQGPMTQDNIDRAEGADGITILGDTKMDAALIEETAKRRIRVVATRTIGYDHIDLNAAKSNGVHVCNGYYDPDGVAEYTVMLILMSLRNYKQALFRGNANDYSLGGLNGKDRTEGGTESAGIRLQDSGIQQTSECRSGARNRILFSGGTVREE